MIDQRDLVTMAAGASDAAMNYLVEVLGFENGEPVSDEQHQALLCTMIYLIANLEANLFANFKNPEAYKAALETIDQLVMAISQKIKVAPPKSGGIITP